MSFFLLSWMELAILSCLIGAFWTSSDKNILYARKHALISSGATFLFSILAWLDFAYLGWFQAGQGYRLFAAIFGKDTFGLDLLNLPLLGSVSLLALILTAVTLKTRKKRFSFSRTLLIEALLLLSFSAQNAWVLIALLGLMIWPQLHELIMRGRSIRVFTIHMGLSMLLLGLGWGLVSYAQGLGNHVIVMGYGFVALGLAIRMGLFPAHCWVIDYFEKASFGTALLSIAPLAPVYAAIRLLLPQAPELILTLVLSLALVTAVYTAAMGTIQKEARRFISYFLLSHASLILAGLMLASLLGMTAGLFLWLSVSLSVMTLGLIIRCIEARAGRVELQNFLGFHTETPTLSALFLVIGLAAIGFPGTLGFFGLEMLMDAASQDHKIFGFLVIVSAALNGIAILRVYSLIFLGRRNKTSIDLSTRRDELFAFLAIILVLIGGSIYPQTGIDSSLNASKNIQSMRNVLDSHRELKPGDSNWR